MSSYLCKDLDKTWVNPGNGLSEYVRLGAGIIIAAIAFEQDSHDLMNFAGWTSVSKKVLLRAKSYP